MTYDYPFIVKDLVTPVKISAAYRPGIDPESPRIQFDALWDTGATGSSISKDVIDKLGLKEITKIKVFNAHGEFKIQSAFLINLLLPCNIRITGVLASEGSFGKDKGTLIGMDIISLGDFSVSNFNGKTTFSFRIPSCERVELKVPQLAVPAATFPTQSRNSPCRCGSGKKYKQCCGYRK